MGLTDSLERSVRSVSSLFCDTRPMASARPRWEMWALALLVLAGALLRFWGLGTWGLENDEETMAMPTMHILQDGHPLLPSGMFYARGIAQLYMMAASVKAFGATEWALRLPSVFPAQFPIRRPPQRKSPTPPAAHRRRRTPLRQRALRRWKSNIRAALMWAVKSRSRTSPRAA